jgi:hypothetical protein
MVKYEENMNRIIAYILMLFGVSVSVFAIFFYPGDYLVFSLFCIVFLGAWFLAWVGPMSYFYLFISTFWLLGYWMKACLHLIIGYDFIEPVGLFNGTGQDWDSAIILAVSGGVGVLAFRLIQIFLTNKSKAIYYCKKSLDSIPKWYVRFRFGIWLISFAIIISVAFFNVKYSINITGLLPTKVFPFKINALTAGLLNIGFAFWIATLVWWEACLDKGWFFKVLAIIIQGLICSVSILSRGAFIFQVFHYLPSIFFNIKLLKISRRLFFSICMIFLISAAVSATFVTELRNYLYAGTSVSSLFKDKKLLNINSEDISGAFGKVLYLASDRWVGLEGAMAVSSYPEIGTSLFLDGWSQKASYSEKPIYEYIADSLYIDPDYPDADKYNFLSISGYITMLGYANSFFVVFFGVIICFTVFSLYEYFIAKELKNPFVMSFFGMYGATLVAQFGNLGLVLIQLIEIAMVLGGLLVLQSFRWRFNRSKYKKIERTLYEKNNVD